VLGSYGGREPGCYLPSFLFNECLLVDAGSGASTLTVAEQSRLKGILISHTHLDHVGEIPFIADNIFGTKDSSLPIVSLQPVLDDLHKYLFNNIIWPDFTVLSAGANPILEFIGIEEGEEKCIAGIKFTAYRVDHSLNAVGYLLSDENGTVLFSGDTGPTEKIWKKAHEADNLRAIITEVSFPNFMKDVAEVAKHLTPKSLLEETKKMPADIPIYLYHEKIRFHDEIAKELEKLNEPRLKMLVQGEIYEF
jgi:ribonuclease BN (tRNA processing enzyme)